MKALIVADQALVDIGLRIALFRASPSVKVFNCRSAAAAFAACMREPPQLLVLDLDTRYCRRLTCARKLLTVRREALLLTITARPDELERHHADETGVFAYLHKAAHPDELSVAVQCALKACG